MDSNVSKKNRHVNLYFKEIYIEITRMCNSSCGHCYLNCSPGASEETLKPETIKQLLTELNGHPLVAQRIVFAGGEPTLFPDILIAMLQDAESIGMESVLITNAWWASRPEMAIQLVRKLKRVKLDKVEISYSAYHEQYISQQCVANAINAFQKMKIPFLLQIRYDCNNTEMNLLHRLNIGALGMDQICSMPINSLETERNDTHLALPKMLEQPKGFCFDDLSLTVAPNGDVFPCCCGSELRDSLKLGNLYSKSISKILEEANENAALVYLLRFGPAELAKILEKQGMPVAESKYNTICALCLKVFQKQNLFQVIAQESLVEMEMRLSTDNLCDRRTLTNADMKNLEFFGELQPSGATIWKQDGRVVKMARDKQGTRLRRQAEWLIQVREQGIDSVPEVLSTYSEGNMFGYAMPEYNLVDIKNKRLLAKLTLEQLAKMWQIPCTDKRKNDPLGYVNATTKILWYSDPDNAERYRQLGHQMLSQLKEGNPCTVHGDPTFENLAAEPMSGKLIILDPNPQQYPLLEIPELDAAKVMQSACGWEEFINSKTNILQLTPGLLAEELNVFFKPERWRVIAWLMISHLIRSLPYGAKMNDSKLLLPSINHCITTLEKIHQKS